MNQQHIQYGCGLSAPLEWKNFDVSLTLQVQKTPILGKLLKNRLNVIFPDNVKYGNIIKGLPGVKDNSCQGVYCSHTLEHLSLVDIKTALKNTHRMLAPGGSFRCVVPDLKYQAQLYLKEFKNGNKDAANKFMKESYLGRKTRPKSLKEHFVTHFTTSVHLWMWDEYSLTEELKNAGFSNIRKCQFNDSEDTLFKLVEDENRFLNAVALEARK